MKECYDDSDEYDYDHVRDSVAYYDRLYLLSLVRLSPSRICSLTWDLITLVSRSCTPNNLFTSHIAEGHVR